MTGTRLAHCPASGGGCEQVFTRGELLPAPAGKADQHIDSPRRFRCNGALGVLRSPHEATCPSIASRFFSEGASMSSFTSISPDKLARLIGTANMPALIDVRTGVDFAAD